MPGDFGSGTADVHSFRYWDETLDAGKFAKSVVFDKTYGFGSSGSGSKNCVPDGPFTGLNVNIGPGFKTEARCVNRKVSDFMSTQVGGSYYTDALSKTTYKDAWLAIYNGPHLAGHISLSMMVSQLLNVRCQ